MEQGKRICNALKVIRRRIAEANSIHYEIEECMHEGNCPGTCPKCERELEDLTNQLQKLKRGRRRINIENLLSEEELQQIYSEDSNIVDRASSRNEQANSDKIKHTLIDQHKEEPYVLQGEIIDTNGMMVARQDNHSFSFKLINQFLGGNENILISPLGICSILQMLQVGMDNKSEIYDKVNQLLDFADSTNLDLLSQEFKLEHVTSIWGDPNRTVFNQRYARKLHRRFGAELHNIDFSKEAETKQALNEWVAKGTHKMIKELDCKITPNTLMILIDVLYLKGKWENPFSASDTHQRLFYNSNGSRSKVDTMHQLLDNIDYGETDRYQTIRLPYLDGDYSMTIVLPKKGHSIDEIMHDDCWLYIQPLDGKVELSLPRFRFDKQQEFMETLSKLGLEELFIPGNPLPNMAVDPVYVSRICQQCAIAVDEEGTEASATSFAELEIGCMPDLMERKIYKMNINRPFGFAIHDDEHILFVGIVKQLDTPKKTPKLKNQKTPTYLKSVVVAGTSHIKSELLLEIDNRLEPDLRLDVKRDYSNTYDSNAIAIYYEKERIGFVPKEENEILARLMDAGHSFFCRIRDVDWKGEWLRIEVDLYMNE